MDNELLTSLRRLSDDALVASLKSLVARERVSTSALVAHLAELDTRDIHLRQGYSSLFVYCRDALSLSEHEAYNRIEVARAARRFPVILEMLAEGAVSLTSVRLLAPHLTPENHRSVLASALGKRKTDAARSHATAAAPGSPARSAPIVPLAVDRYKLQMTISGDTLRKLRLAKDMLRHAVPSGDDAAILDLQPFATGGEPTVSNIELRCGRHNRYEAKVFFATPNSFWNESPSPPRATERCPG
jgi:hypothetical protein